MSLRFGTAAHAAPANVLFPEEYRASARMIVRDFVFFGASMVAFVVALAVVFG